MMKSLYSGVAGMKTHNQRMDVIGNNVSNVNTTGYKTSTVTFKDVYYQTKSAASEGDATSGGTNPTQVGYGASLGTIQQVMTQSGFTYSDSVYDCAIEGEGFFQVMDESGNTFYTRAGVFSIDSYGNLVDPNGYIVLGVSGDPTLVTEGSSQRINIVVPAVDNNIARATKLVNGYEVEISAGIFGEAGNIAFTIVDSDTPYATKSGTNLTVYMDLSEPFGKEVFENLTADSTDEEKQAAFEAAVQEFQDALNGAITQGGVGLEEGVLPLKVEFGSMPPYNEVLAKNATNSVTLSSTNAATGDTDELQLTFTAGEAGEFANKYEMNIKTVSGQSYVSAKWNGDVLTITVPETGATLGEIQDAINDAAGGNSSLNIIVEAALNGEEVEAADEIDFDFGKALGKAVERVGLDNGADNFFADMATALSTVTLTDGRVASEQSIDDLETVVIADDGVIYGRHAVHGLLLLGRIDIVTFENPTGLDQVGTSLWRESLASGEPEVKIAGSDGSGKVVSGALEMSNVDLAQEFSDMIITQRGYQANSRIITVSDTMLEELVNLKR